MAVENKLSTTLTNLDAVPKKVADARNTRGRLREIVETIAVAAADDNASTYRVARVHSSWRISSLEVLNDAITGGSGYDLGLYETAENGGAAVDDDAYASTVDMSSARVAPLDIAFEARNINAIKNQIWQDAGLSADPNKYYDLVFTADVVGTAAGDIALRARFAENS